MYKKHEIKKVYWEEIQQWKAPPKLYGIIMDKKQVNHQFKGKENVK